MAEAQSYANHRRWYPLYHFVVIPILSLNVLLQIWYVIRHPLSFPVWWALIVSIAIVSLAATARFMVLTVQNRVIRLEERLRLQQILPEDLRSRIGELRTRQLIALRFCDDAEAPELCRAVLNGELKDSDQIKRSVRSWRPDTLRA